MESLQRIGDFFVNEYKKNGIKWLTRAKYTSMVASPFLAAFGAVKADREIQKRKKERNVEKLPLIETAGIIVKNEAGAAISMVGGIVASVKVDEKYQQTIDALTTAVVLGEDKLREIKEAEKEVVGKEKSEEIQKKAKEKLVSKEETNEKIDPGDIYKCRCSFSGMEIRTTQALFDKALLALNYDVINGFEQRLNEFLGNCDIDPFVACEESKIGELYGWVPNNKRTGYSGIDLVYKKDENGKPFYLIVYESQCEPVLLSDYEFE